METAMPKPPVNDPCPCGSGKKYKKCCKDAPVPSVTVGVPQDLTQIIVPPLKRQFHEFPSLLQKTEATLLRRARRRAEWRDPVVLDADRVRRLISEIDDAAQRLLRLHSQQYWYFLVRRVPREFWVDFGVLTTATDLVLTCAPKGEPHEFYKGGRLKGIAYGDVLDQLSAVIELMALALIRHNATVLYRLACKGIQIYDTATLEPLLAQADDSIMSYEARRAEHETLGGSAGLWLDPVRETPLRPGVSSFWGIEKLPAGGGEDGRTHTLISHSPPKVINLRLYPSIYEEVPYDLWLNEFSRAVERMLGLPGAEVATFLYALFQVVTHVLRYPEIRFTGAGTGVFDWAADTPPGDRQNALSHWADLTEMGLLRASEDSWQRKLCYYAALLAAQDPSVIPLDENRVREIMRVFTVDSLATADPDRPVLFNAVSKETLVLDLLRAGDFLRYLMVQVSKSDEVRERQRRGARDIFVGHYFERQVAEFFIRTLGLDRGKVLVSKVIKGEKEIDLAFVYRTTLFVFDCKALRKDAGYVEGHHRKIRNRLDKIKEEFDKCRDRIELIERGRAAPAILPADFSTSRVMVCTSAVEYLPADDNLFWYRGEPLVGTPTELVETIRKYVG
jgi:hypothetical protein